MTSGANCRRTLIFARNLPLSRVLQPRRLALGLLNKRFHLVWRQSAKGRK